MTFSVHSNPVRANCTIKGSTEGEAYHDSSPPVDFLAGSAPFGVGQHEGPEHEAPGIHKIEQCL